MTSDSQWAAKLCAERGNLLSFQFGQKSWNLGTVCGNSARTDLWGKRWATGASTRKKKANYPEKHFCPSDQSMICLYCLSKPTGENPFIIPYANRSYSIKIYENFCIVGHFNVT